MREKQVTQIYAVKISPYINRVGGLYDRTQKGTVHTIEVKILSYRPTKSDY